MFLYQIDFCQKMITIEQVNVFNLLDPGDSCVLYERKKITLSCVPWISISCVYVLRFIMYDTYIDTVVLIFVLMSRKFFLGLAQPFPSKSQLVHQAVFNNSGNDIDDFNIQSRRI
jgi:hypothetical protein